MPRELEDSEDAENPERNEGAAHVVVVGDDEPDVVRDDSHHVNDAHDATHELAAVRGGVKPEEVLGREDHDAGRV